MKNSELLQKAALVRKWCLISTTEGGSGHPSSCLSAADLATVLFDKYFTYDLKNPKNPENDRFVLSKGHAAPLLYTLFALSGAFPLEDLRTLRKFGSPLEGHPTPNFKYTEAATGSLGQGLSVGAGLALTGKLDKRLFKTYVVLGDGELAEGSVWEAANFASYYKLDNLIAIADINRMGQSQPTMFQHHLEEYIYRFSGFGWEVLAIDGHNLEEVDKALSVAVKNTSGKPFVIVAKTKKGKGISLFEDKENWHGKPLKKEELEQVLPELGNVSDNLRFNLKTPKASVPPKAAKKVEIVPEYEVGSQEATREVYGQVLAKLGDQNSNIVALDGDTKNSTYSQEFKKAHIDRFFESFIAEQNMVGVGLGMARLGKIPFVSTFACFLTRAFDQIRMARVSQGNIKFVGSHAGVSIGEDGPSQMGLEDIAMFGVLPDVVVFHPCDAVSTAKVLPLVVNQQGMFYLRTLRPKTPVLYKANETFSIGGSKILRQSKDDVLTVAACGITVHEALKAYEELKKEGIAIRVVDCYCVKPVDKETLTACARATSENIVITVEDHFSHGGFGDFVLEALTGVGTLVEKMAVTHISRSGKQAELLADAGIDSAAIISKVKEFSSK